MNKLHLFINGQSVQFYAASLVFSVEQLAHTFNCSIPIYNITQPLPVEFKLNDKTIFTGQIDGTDTQTDSGRETLRIYGRSLSANLIDSRIKMDAIYGQPFDKLLAKVVADFGLGVNNQVKGALPQIPEFQINAENPVSNLAQIARQQGLVMFEHLGAIQIEKPGQFTLENIRLEEGINLQNFRISRNWADQFYHYEVQGAWDSAEAIVTYAAANTSRKKIIIADKLQDQASCQARAEYERDLAIAKGLTVSATVPGIHPQLTAATLNKIVQIQSKPKGFNENLLMKSITINVTDKQQSTNIALFRAFGQGSANV